MNIEPSVYFSIYFIYVTTGNNRIFGNANQPLSINLLLLLSIKKLALKKNCLGTPITPTSHQGSHKQKFSLDLANSQTNPLPPLGLGYNT